ncbi:MAG: hypothetical protein GXY89_07995 [Tissierellia bacterium]|nr:hypothetical protein [Tissierellia bacterium]
MTYNKYKNKIEKMMKEDYENFFKALVSLERNINDEDVLDDMYYNYMDNDDVMLISEDI